FTNQQYGRRKKEGGPKKKLVETRCTPSYILSIFEQLTKSNAEAKSLEINAMEFEFLRFTPRWTLKQKIMVALARSYDLASNKM
ncbi:hypothetical protein S245_021257, partial [Arachis hypogaea]